MRPKAKQPKAKRDNPPPGFKPKNWLQKYLKQRCLESADEMIELLEKKARGGDRPAMKFLVEMALGKPTERHIIDPQPIEVFDDLPKPKQSKANADQTVGEV